MKNRSTFVPAVLLVAVMVGFSPVARAAEPYQQSHGHDCETASFIPLNGATKATLADTNDFAVYRIVLERRGLLDVTIDPGALDVSDLQLLNSSCKIIQELYCDTSMVTGSWARITVPHKDILHIERTVLWTLESGVYFVRIQPSPGKVFGEELTFHTKFIPHYGHDIETADLIALNRPVDGELLYPEDREVFRITTTQEGQIHAWTTEPVDGADKPLIELYQSDGSSGSETQTSGQDGVGIVTGLLPPGTYYFSVRPRPTAKLGRFTLNLEFH